MSVCAPLRAAPELDGEPQELDVCPGARQSHTQTECAYQDHYSLQHMYEWP